VALDDFAEGNEGDYRRVANQLADTAHRIVIMVAPHLGMTARLFEAWVADRDGWLSADEALEMGAVDGVLP
jgi:ATP-dependent protease ClpP protease subunit